MQYLYQQQYKIADCCELQSYNSLLLLPAWQINVRDGSPLLYLLSLHVRELPTISKGDNRARSRRSHLAKAVPTHTHTLSLCVCVCGCGVPCHLPKSTLHDESTRFS